MFVALTKDTNHEVVAWDVNSDLCVAQIRSCDCELSEEASATSLSRDVELEMTS